MRVFFAYPYASWCGLALKTGWCLVMSLCLTTTYGQNAPTINYRHLKNTQGVELTAGISDLGMAGSMAYSRFFTSVWYGKVVCTYEFLDEPRFRSQALTAEVVGARSVILERSFFLSLLAGGAVVVFESLDGFEATTPLNTAGVGLVGGVEMEYYVSNHLALLADGMARYIFGSDLGRQRVYAAAGLKFIF